MMFKSMFEKSLFFVNLRNINKLLLSMNKFLNNYFLLSSFVIIFLFSACKQFERVFIFKNNAVEIKNTEKKIIFNAEFVDINPNNNIVEYGHVWSSVRPVPLLSKDRFSKNGLLDAPKAFNTDFLKPSPDSAYFVRAYAINSVNDTLYTNVQTVKLNLSEIVEINAISSIETNIYNVKVAINLESLRYKYPNFNPQGNIICNVIVPSGSAETTTSILLDNIQATNVKIYATAPVGISNRVGQVIKAEIVFMNGSNATTIKAKDVIL